MDGVDGVAKEGNREAEGKEEEKEGRQGGGTWEMLFPDASKSKKKKTIKVKLVVKKGGKLTHGIHIHCGNEILGPWDGGMRRMGWDGDLPGS